MLGVVASKGLSLFLGEFDFYNATSPLFMPGGLSFDLRQASV